MDATKSLDLVGCTYARMMDILPATPLVIVSGHFESSIRKSPEDDNLRYWPYKILGPGRVSAICADYPTYTDSQTRYNLAKVAGKWSLSGGEPAEIGPARTFFADGWGGQVPQSALADVKRWSKEGFEPQAETVSRNTSFGRLINLTYFPITPGYDACMHDAEAVAAYVGVGDTVVSLDKCTPSGYKFSEIVWVDDKGWLIVRASKGKQDGFAWLYLRKPHN